MNLQNILNELESVDGEIVDRLAHVSRRGMFSMLSRKAVAAAAPAVMAAGLSQAYGQSGLPAGVVNVLNFALTLEYLEYEFYLTGTDRAGLIPMQTRTIFMQIRKHEDAHVRLLRSVLGSQAVSKPTFDFTAKGAFPTVFSDYQTFLAVSQAFEDTGVRAYKGQAGNLIVAPAILEAALNIHSVEARHAARVRVLRGNKGWITNADATGLPAAIYAGDAETTQLGVQTAGLGGKSAAAASEAYDEPLSMDQVLEIVKPFLA